ncbi:hypothetical protein C8J56DRAFT_885613 [Mycena floridula]|nr:hypothetical protein C8J56DRAFT_885613 [Mycena floridula]
MPQGSGAKQLLVELLIARATANPGVLTTLSEHLYESIGRRTRYDHVQLVEAPRRTHQKSPETAAPPTFHTKSPSVAQTIDNAAETPILPTAPVAPVKGYRSVGIDISPEYTSVGLQTGNVVPSLTHPPCHDFMVVQFQQLEYSKNIDAISVDMAHDTDFPAYERVNDSTIDPMLGTTNTVWHVTKYPGAVGAPSSFESTLIPFADVVTLILSQPGFDPEPFFRTIVGRSGFNRALLIELWWVTHNIWVPAGLLAVREADMPICSRLPQRLQAQYVLLGSLSDIHSSGGTVVHIAHQDWMSGDKALISSHPGVRFGIDVAIDTPRITTRLVSVYTQAGSFVQLDNGEDTVEDPHYTNKADFVQWALEQRKSAQFGDHQKAEKPSSDIEMEDSLSAASDTDSDYRDSGSVAVDDEAGGDQSNPILEGEKSALEQTSHEHSKPGTDSDDQASGDELEKLLEEAKRGQEQPRKRRADPDERDVRARRRAFAGSLAASEPNSVKPETPNPLQSLILFESEPKVANAIAPPAPAAVSGQPVPLPFDSFKLEGLIPLEPEQQNVANAIAPAASAQPPSPPPANRATATEISEIQFEVMNKIYPTDKHPIRAKMAAQDLKKKGAMINLDDLIDAAQFIAAVADDGGPTAFREAHQAKHPSNAFQANSWKTELLGRLLGHHNTWGVKIRDIGRFIQTIRGGQYGGEERFSAAVDKFRLTLGSENLCAVKTFGDYLKKSVDWARTEEAAAVAAAAEAEAAAAEAEAAEAAEAAAAAAATDSN